MARPKCPRLIGALPNITFFKPRAIPLAELEEVALSFDEYEAIRLADFKGLYQEEAASQMGISRPTFGRIIESAHKKIADALINGKAIKIEGGVISMAQKRLFQCSDCEHYWEIPFGTGRPAACPSCQSSNFCRADGLRGQDRGEKGICRRRRGGLRMASTKEDK
jgi:uncharacterized protein